MWGVMFSSMVIGFSIAAPVGPIGVLCMRRTLTYGRLIGWLSGLGAASADAVYGMIAALGMGFVITLLTEQMLYLQILGGVFLLYLGGTTFFTQAKPLDLDGGDPSSLPAWQAISSTFALTLTNPLTILSFLGIFSGYTLDGQSAPYWVVLGVFLGSLLWWTLLSGGVALLRNYLQPTWLGWLNRVAGAIIVVFALQLLWQALM